MKTLAACTSAHWRQERLARYNSSSTVYSAQVSCKITGHISTVRAPRTLIGLLSCVSDHMACQKKLFIKPMELPSTMRAWQRRSQVPRPWIAACLARGVRARCTVGLVHSRRWRGASHQGTAPRQPLKYTKASSYPWSGSSFTILLLFFFHPNPCLIHHLLVLSLGNITHSISWPLRACVLHLAAFKLLVPCCSFPSTRHKVTRVDKSFSYFWCQT